MNEFSNANQAGSCIYYSTRFLTPEQRDALLALYSVVEQILATPFASEETSVCTAKLQWWQEEIDQLFIGSPRHPAALELLPYVEKHHLAKEYFDEIIVGASMDIEQGRFADYADLSLYLHRTGSMPAMLACMIGGYENHSATKFAHLVGEHIRLQYLVANTPALMLSGRFYLPDADLKLAELSYTDFSNPVTPERIIKQFRYQFSRINKGLTKSLTHLDKIDRSKQRHLLTRLRIAEAISKKIEKNNYALLEGSVEITPLHKVWIAWRTK